MKADIGLIFKYILAIIIPLIVYFGIGWIAKDIYFSIWEIVDSTTLEEIYNKEILVYACVAVGYIILCHIILDYIALLVEWYLRERSLLWAIYYVYMCFLYQKELRF